MKRNRLQNIVWHAASLETKGLASRYNDGVRALRDRLCKIFAGKAHSDVRRLGKAEVAGSIPVASSKDSMKVYGHLTIGDFSKPKR